TTPALFKESVLPPPINKVWDPLVAPSDRLPTVALTFNVTMYVPLEVIKTSSDEPGTWLGCQLAATSQLPPAVFVQLIVAASVTLLNTGINAQKKRVLSTRLSLSL